MNQPCASCLQVKSALVQIGFGIVQPCILAPLSTFMFATRHFTFRMPLPFKEPREFAKFLRKVSKPLMFDLAIICGIQVLLTMYITHKEFDSFLTVQRKMIEPLQEAEVMENANTIKTNVASEKK